MLQLMPSSVFLTSQANVLFNYVTIRGPREDDEDNDTVYYIDYMLMSVLDVYRII